MNCDLICTSCGIRAHTRPSRHPGANLWTDVLWGCFLIPGLLQTTWRGFLQPPKCPICVERTLIPLNSLAGREVAKKYPQLARVQAYALRAVHLPGVAALTVGSVSLIVLALYLGWPHAPVSVKSPTLVDSEVVYCARANSNPCAAPSNLPDQHDHPAEKHASRQ